MKKISCTLASLPLITTACGGSGGGGIDYGNNSNLDLSQHKGIWSDSAIQSYTSASGKTTTFQAPTGLVTSQQGMIILTGNAELYVVEPGANTAHYFKSFAYSTEISPDSRLTQGEFEFSYYDPKRDANGVVTLPATSLFDTAFSFNNMASTWNDSYDADGWVFTINNDGSFDASAGGGCNATGNFSHIDPTKSELTVSITFTNCFPLQGTHTGLAWSHEDGPGTILNVAVYDQLDEFGKARGWKLIKQ